MQKNEFNNKVFLDNENSAQPKKHHAFDMYCVLNSLNLWKQNFALHQILKSFPSEKYHLVSVVSNRG